MVNTELLETKIKESGLSKKYIANKLGITTQAFWTKRIGENEFTASEIRVLCDLLKITSLQQMKQIFLN